MLRTRLCDFFDIQHPVIQAPMAFAAGGVLASAVTHAGGLGLIGGAYGDVDWIATEFRNAGNARIGCGLITWAVADKPHVVEQVLEHRPRALFLSFGDPGWAATMAHERDVPVICQVQTLDVARQALDAGAQVIVAQGAEAGGHGESRATFTLVPEIANLLAKSSPETILCAAGGIADGRGLAAALMLGADGVLVGSRFWASQEALVHEAMHREAIKASGDDTIRSSVMDIARRLNWPERYTARVLKNGFTDKWHDDLPGLMAVQDEEADRWRAAWQAGDMDVANTFVGEATGLINDIQPAAVILEQMVQEARAQLNRYG